MVEGSALGRSGQTEAVVSQVDLGDVEIYRRGTPEEPSELKAADSDETEAAAEPNAAAEPEAAEPEAAEPETAETEAAE